MALYEYVAMTQTGRAVTGTLEASSPEDARETLQQGMKLWVNSITLAKTKSPASKLGKAEFLLFNQQLASITKAGIPLERGLRELAKDADSPRMRKLMNEIADDLEAGKSLDDIFENRKGRIPPLYGHLLKAGLKSGRLSEMLTSLNRHLEMAAHTRRILLEAILYPLVVLALAAGVLTFLFVVLVPQFESILADFGGHSLSGEDMPMPAISRLMFTMAHNAAVFWGIVGAVLVAIVLAMVLLSTFQAGRKFKERVCLSVPILGRLYHLSLLARLADAMATLVGAGCDMPTCLRMSGAATGSEVMRSQCGEIASEIEKGGDFFDGAQSAPYIPKLFLFSLHLGSQRNELPDNLYSLSDMYARQVQHNQSRLQAVLMPLMLIVVGGIMGLVISALFMPLVAVLHLVEAI